MITLTKLDRSHYRISEPDTFFTKGSKLYKRVGVDEVFVEDIIFKIWNEIFKSVDGDEAPELEMEVALDEMGKMGHPVAMFTTDGVFTYTLSKEDYEASIEKV